MPQQSAYQIPNAGDSNMTALRQIASSDLDFKKMVTDISHGGIRSLEVLSLSECRQITDNGIKRVGKVCKLLRKVCFLGCGNLKDAGVIGMAS